MNDQLLEQVPFLLEDLTALLPVLYREAPSLLRKIVPNDWDDSPGMSGHTSMMICL